MRTAGLLLAADIGSSHKEEKPADLPLQARTNLKLPRRWVSRPSSLLARANEVIELV